MPMYALLHEELGAAEFSQYFKGDLLLDVEKRFYGPEERRMLLTGMLRWSVWQNLRRASNKGVDGNLKGDGSLLGSKYIAFSNTLTCCSGLSIWRSSLYHLLVATHSKIYSNHD